MTVTTASATDHYDVIVIGSGPGGGTTAAELAKTGKRILLLERGDFLTRERENWDSKSVFSENRYVADETFYDIDDKPFRPELHYFVGGNSKVYGAALFRLTPADFGGIRHPGGISPEWPISYDDLEPFYVKGEHLYWVRGKHGEDPFAGPTSAEYKFPPVAHAPRIQELSDGLQKMGLHPFHLPVGVNLIQNADGSAAVGSPCIRCDRVDGFPCLVEAKADSESVVVRPALTSHPNLRLLTNTQVTRLVTNTAGTALTGITTQAPDGTKTTFTADIIVLSAGSILSSALLLASATDKHPDGLANSSGQVGRNYMRHNNLALIAFSKDRNDTVFQKTLAMNDFYGPSSKWEFPMGNIQMLGKSDDWQVKGQAPKGLGWAPPAAYGIVGKHSMDFWLASEDLPLPDSRVTLTKDGSVKLTVQPDNNAEGLKRLRLTMAALVGPTRAI